MNALEHTSTDLKFDIDGRNLQMSFQYTSPIVLLLAFAADMGTILDVA